MTNYKQQLLNDLETLELDVKQLKAKYYQLMDENEVLEKALKLASGEIEFGLELARKRIGERE